MMKAKTIEAVHTHTHTHTNSFIEEKQGSNTFICNKKRQRKYYGNPAVIDKATNTGITLVALVVTIVVLLILAGITINYVIGDHGISKLAQEAKEKTDNAKKEEQERLENLVNYIEKATNVTKTDVTPNPKPDPKPVPTDWTQDKTNVTNGVVTFEVGQEVTGYTANSVGDGKWCVLGAEDGKLLITTNSNQGTVELSFKQGYTDGVETLNAEGAKFKDNNMAESARSINVEDINRVTGYRPEVAKYNEGTEEVAQWENDVTYTLKSDGKIYYQGTKYPKTDTISTIKKFEYWDGSELARNKSKTITNDYYWYFPQTLSTTYVNEQTVNGSAKAYNLLFDGVVSQSTYYWLSSTYCEVSKGYCQFGMRIVQDRVVKGQYLYATTGLGKTETYGVRPAVTLKSNVKVTESGALSI